MAISTLSRFELTKLQALTAGALGDSEKGFDVRVSDTGTAVPSGPFITLREISALELGLPNRKQIDADTEEISQHVELQVSVQAFGQGAMHVLKAYAAWLGSTPGMSGLSGIGTSCPRYTLPRNVSEGIPGGWEERAVMTLTLSHTDRYRISQNDMQEFPITVTDGSNSISFTVHED
ncbi:hypothetical protein ERD95_15785 [Enterobacteriaceae bacterium ML5]|nr:hypothetical protein ERD95_15785 [Enterobacteriaceae bacterium ML5]